MPKGVVILPSYYEAIRELPDNERLKIYDSIMEYGFEGVIPELSGTTKAIWLLIKPNLDKSGERYERNCRNGSNGGRPPKGTQKKPTGNPDETQTKPTGKQDYDLEKDSDYDLEKDSEKDFSYGTTVPKSEFSRYLEFGMEDEE